MRTAIAIAVALAASVLPASVQAADKAASPAPAAADTRTPVVLDAHGRAALLAEMRVHLVNLQIILDALARNDMGAVAKAARASGVQAATEADQRMMKQLPKNFVELGVSMHRDFDVIADEAEKAKDPKLTLSALSATLQKCVACHATYQVRLRRPAPKK